MSPPNSRLLVLACLVITSLHVGLTRAENRLDQRPAGPGEWGYRPGDGSRSAVNPPSFSWRPQRDIDLWELECQTVDKSESAVYRSSVRKFNVHTPARAFAPGKYRWRYRGRAEDGKTTEWSRYRAFTLPANAAEMPMPSRSELLGRIPTHHPRLFVRPEDLPRLKELARGSLKAEYEQLVRQSEQLLATPPPTAEPPKYPPGTVRNSDAWRKIWWGNRTYTIRALNGAATLAFTRLLGGKEEYGRQAKRILMACAEWDPKGATGYRYNDEAGMPYNYYFARTYTFVNDLLTDEERALCLRILKVRGDEMYRHLYPRHLWTPYSSHSNRAWHFLGEVGIATLGEVEGADDWVWMAMNVFYNTYPVWSDADGGWHEGTQYWRSYIDRFTWWADVMRAAMGVNAYVKPYFSQIGYYPIYLLPPGKIGGGFGDLNARATSADCRTLMSQLAVQASNGYWQAYVEQLGGPRVGSGYIGFVRGSLPPVKPRALNALPSSRIFRGIGQAVLNTTLENANNDVQIVFKSSPFGTWSHGYEANNSFLLWAYGQRLLIRSGYRDSYGTEHHRRWMWSTRSVNNITVDQGGQLSHSQASVGRIVAFASSPTVDYVVGEAGDAYRPTTNAPSALNRFTRSILFVKPDLIVVYDSLAARTSSTFEYWLHATHPFDAKDPRRIRLNVDDVDCDIELLAPTGLRLTQTDQYDPNPRPRITLREWHLTAATSKPARQVEFVAVYRPRRHSDPVPARSQLVSDEENYTLKASQGETSVEIQLPKRHAQPDRNVVIVRRDPGGKELERVRVPLGK